LTVFGHDGITVSTATSTNADAVNAGVPVVTYDDVVRAIETRAATLVDVLSAESYAAAHLPDAINLPVADLARLAPEHLPDRDARIITYCGSPT
jgi:rhodanese-related sulfurtransferase